MRMAVASILLCGLAMSSAVAQGWSETEASSVVRVGATPLRERYARPGIFFLGRPAAAMPRSYSLVHPFSISRIESGNGYVVREFEHRDRSGRPIYTWRDSGKGLAVISGSRP